MQTDANSEGERSEHEIPAVECDIYSDNGLVGLNLKALHDIGLVSRTGQPERSPLMSDRSDVN